MFKESDFDELHDDIQDAQGETINAATTRVNTVSTPVTIAGVTISTAEPRTPPTTTIVFDDEDVTMAMAQTLIKMKEHKAKEKGVAIREEEAPKITTTRSITTLQPLPAIDPKDKGKGVLVEEDSDPSVKVKRSDQGDAQIQADAELAKLLHQKDIDANALFAAKLQQKENEQFTIEERAKFLVETIAAQRKFRAAQRAAEIRSKPPTKTQMRTLMMTFLKHMGDYKYSQLKGKTYEEIHELYERQNKRIQDFIPMDSEKEMIKEKEKKDEISSKSAKGSRRKSLAKKRAGEKQKEESAKRKKTEDMTWEQESTKSNKEEASEYEQEKEELRMWLTIVMDEEETGDPEILSTKYPIVDWESHNLGGSEVEDLHVFKIIRADGNTSYHKSLSSMLRKFDRQD
ncbi:hypothetical protein Tco_0651058 [Tanacetum coccineum]